MRARLASMMLFLAAAPVAGSACAMNSPTPQLVDCRVVGGDKLPADSGGSEALCKAIAEAAAEQAPGRRFTVDVQVLGRSALKATVTNSDGTKLPEQKMAISDRGLTRGSLERFAKAIVGEVAQAKNR